MPIIHVTPISMKALNLNIDDNLIFNYNDSTGFGYSTIKMVDDASFLTIVGADSTFKGGSILLKGQNKDSDEILLQASNAAGTLDIPVMVVHGASDTPTVEFLKNAIFVQIDSPTVKTDHIQEYTANHHIVCDNQVSVAAGGIDRTADNDALRLYGGIHDTAGQTVIAVRGVSSTGHIQFYTPTGAGAVQEVLRIEGNTATPTINGLAWRISNIADPTTANDALRYNAVTTWTPTLVWSGTTPGTPQITARYQKLTPKTYYVEFQVYSSDSNGSSLTSFTTPITSPNVTGDIQSMAGFEQHGTSLATRTVMAWSLPSNSNVCSPLNTVAGVDGQAIRYVATGILESA